MERSSFPDPEPSLTVIDPSLIYTPPRTYASNTSSDADTSPPAADAPRSEHTSPTPTPDHPSPASSGAQSHVSELAASRKLPPPQDHSRNPYYRHAQRPPHLQRPSSSLRQRPYTPRTRRPGPTSAPASVSSVVFADRDGSPAVHNDAEQYIFTTYRDQTTLVMGVLVHLDALARQCEDMKTFIKTGYGEGNEDPNDGRSRIERTRLELRNWNRTHVTELDEILQPLPRLDDGEIPRDAPSTGKMIQRLGHTEMTRLLDAYDLPFIPTMFLHEKKAIYLRFVGAGRALMHRVLDEQLSGPTG